MSEKWVSGYHGEDSLRNKAHRMLGHELKGANYKIPESMSSPGHTKMRPYAEGGHAEAEGGKLKRGGHAKHHKLNHDQKDMHIPHRAKTAPIAHMSKEKSESLKRGGTPKLNRETVKEFNFAEGGHASGGDVLKKGGHAHHTQQHKHHAARAAMHKKELENYRHGGHVHHKADGGMVQAGGPFGQVPAPQTADPTQPGMRKGGHMKHKKASGGSIYEKHMVGERPSHKRPSINYESEMRGEKPTRKPSTKHESKKGLVDKNHHQMFAEGGFAAGGKECSGGAMKRGGHSHKKHHKAEGGETRMAAGGVGKIRHNAATASGKPKGAGRVIRNNLF